MYSKYRIPKVNNFLQKNRGKNLFFTFMNCFGILKKLHMYETIIIGGADNYDVYSKKPFEFNFLISLIKLFKKADARMILHDCSIAKNNINKFFIADLKKVDAVTARDSVSYANIKDCIGDGKLYLIADPAFLISGKEIDNILDKDKRYIGINISPIVLATNSNVEVAYINLINYITENTAYSVLLVPHVMLGRDVSALKKVYNKCAHKDKITLINNQNLSGRELKYLISKCNFFVTARTHASIAAYSSCVPTIVIGYSIKSKAIALDLFGTDKLYVQDAAKIKTGNELIESIQYLFKNENAIREQLKKQMIVNNRRIKNGSKAFNRTYN